MSQDVVILGPHPLLRKVVRGGLLGWESGRGFYVDER